VTRNHACVLPRAGVAGRTFAAALGAYALLVALASSAVAHGQDPPSPVSATDVVSGYRLPDNSVLHTRQQVALTASGFAARTQVVVALVGVQTLAHVAADARGQAFYTYALSSKIGCGQHQLVFSGAVASADTGKGNAGNVLVAVPLTEGWRFHTPECEPPHSRTPSHGIGGASSHRAGASDEHEHTASTGFDGLGLVVLGLAAVARGVGLVRAGTRRRQRLPRPLSRREGGCRKMTYAG
jgi:hypothetical protein